MILYFTLLITLFPYSNTTGNVHEPPRWGPHASRDHSCLLITCHHIAIPAVVTTVVGEMGSHCTSTLPKILLLLDHYTVQLWLKSYIGQLGHQRQDLHEPEMRTFHHTKTTRAQFTPMPRKQ